MVLGFWCLGFTVFGVLGCRGLGFLVFRVLGVYVSWGLGV